MDFAFDRRGLSYIRRKERRQANPKRSKGDLIMKKFARILLVLAMSLCLMSTAAWAEGTVSTDGSTSMEKVIGALGRILYGAEHRALPSPTIPPAPVPASPPCSEGRCDIGLSSRSLKDEEKANGLTETVLALRRHRHHCASRQPRGRLEPGDHRQDLHRRDHQLEGRWRQRRRNRGHRP